MDKQISPAICGDSKAFGIPANHWDPKNRQDPTNRQVPAWASFIEDMKSVPFVNGWVVAQSSNVTAQQIINYGFQLQGDRLYPDSIEEIGRLLGEDYQVTDVTPPGTTSLTGCPSRCVRVIKTLRVLADIQCNVAPPLCQRVLFFGETGCVISRWVAEGRVNSAQTHYVECGFKASLWAPLPLETDERWIPGNPWAVPEAQDVDVLTLSTTLPSGRRDAYVERKRPGDRLDVNYPAFAGSKAWMLVSDLRNGARQLPDVTRTLSAKVTGDKAVLSDRTAQEQARGTVLLPDGFQGDTVRFYLEPLEVDGELVKLGCAEPGLEYLIAWKRSSDVNAAKTLQSQTTPESFNPARDLPFMTAVAGHILIHAADGCSVLPGDWIGICVDARDVSRHWHIGQDGGERSYTALQAKDFKAAVIEVEERQLENTLEVDPLTLTPEALRRWYEARCPECKAMSEEFVALGLADHPDFIRLMETSIVQPFDLTKRQRAGLFAARLLDNARTAAKRRNHAVIGGHRCGVQSCDAETANVHAEIEGVISYIRLNRKDKIVLKPLYTNPAFEFVKQHFDAFEQLCSSLDQSK